MVAKVGGKQEVQRLALFFLGESPCKVGWRHERERYHLNKKNELDGAGCKVRALIYPRHDRLADDPRADFGEVAKGKASQGDAQNDEVNAAELRAPAALGQSGQIVIKERPNQAGMPRQPDHDETNEQDGAQ